MTVEEIPSDELVTMTDFWHKAFNIAGCNPQCHCCYKKIKIGANFKLATVFKATDNAFHWDKDLSELQIKALKGQEIKMEDLTNLKNDWNFEERFKSKGGLKGIQKLSQPENKEVMLCESCNTEAFTTKQIAILEGRIIERDKPKGGCFRVNGKIVA